MKQESDSGEGSSNECLDVILARAGKHDIVLRDLFSFLRRSFKQEILMELILEVLLLQACQERSLEATEDELASRMSGYRSERGLLSVAEVRTWLEENQLSQDELWEICRYEVKFAKLKNAIVDQERVQEFFAFNRADYETVELYQILVQSQAKAQELAALVKDGRSFFELARKHSEDEASRAHCGYRGKLLRSSLQPEIESLVYASEPGELLGPLKCLGKYHLLLVERFHPPELSKAVEAEIRERLFSAWQKDLLNRSSVQILV